MSKLYIQRLNSVGRRLTCHFGKICQEEKFEKLYLFMRVNQTDIFQIDHAFV